MAQASSVPAREPSMEEILASIRRIIEDSDSVAAPGGVPAGGDADHGTANEAAAPVTHETEQVANQNASEEVSADIEAFRSELSEPSHDPVSAPVEEDRPEPESVAPQAEPDSFADDEYAEPAPAVEAHVPNEPAAAPAGHFEPRSEPVTHAPLGNQAPARTSIISETAERQVAAAFEELSDAFAASQKRSFDEIAEDLMRPMLQDWLDNNLPLLVERLVREEIERVARGAR